MFEGWAAATAASVVGSVASAEISGSAAKSAANTQASRPRLTRSRYPKTNSIRSPSKSPPCAIQAGYGSLNALNQGLGTAPENSTQAAPGVGYGSLTTPFNAQNFKDLSPAYQFQQQQGMQGVLNGDSSGQGALSGATAKDLIEAKYNQNLANTSFNNAFNQYQTQTGNIYSRLSGIASMGQNAASNTGQQGTALAGQAAQSATNIGSAQAAGQIELAVNAISGGLSSLSALPWLYGQGGRRQQVAQDGEMERHSRTPLAV